jgi:hypothetical protein
MDANKFGISKQEKDFSKSDEEGKAINNLYRE